MAVKTPEKTEEMIIVLPPDMEVDPQSKDILRRAYAALKRRGGWVQDTYSAEDDSRFCAVGAIHWAGGGPPASGNTISKKAAGYFARMIGKESWGEIPVWNDAPKRRKRDVLRVFEELIKD